MERGVMPRGGVRLPVGPNPSRAPPVEVAVRSAETGLEVGLGVLGDELAHPRRGRGVDLVTLRGQPLGLGELAERLELADVEAWAVRGGDDDVAASTSNLAPASRRELGGSVARRQGRRCA